MPIIVNLDVMMAKRKISLNELSERVGLTLSNLSILKTGKAKAIRFSTLEAICRALDCQPSDILEYVNDEKEYLYSALKEISFIKVFEPSVNFIMFKILKNIDLKYELLRKKILIRSCDNYIGLNNSFYRVAVRNREENNELIRQLKNILFDK